MARFGAFFMRRCRSKRSPDERSDIRVLRQNMAGPCVRRDLDPGFRFAHPGYVLPVPPKGAPYKNFCEKGGRFGPHNVNQEIHLPDVERPGNLIYLTYFNGGLRVYDIKDPLLPVESGWFIPPQPSERAGPLPRDLVTQTEDVLVDSRGYIYVTDKQWGLWILRYSGPDQPAAIDK
jgi:hypothetical protein